MIFISSLSCRLIRCYFSLVSTPKAAGLTVTYFVPPVVMYALCIPDIVGKMTILMSAKDLSLASKKEKAVLVRRGCCR
jgi:hypothetical protein